MDLQLYTALRRFTPDSDGTERLRQRQSRFVRMIALLIIEADRLGFELSFGDSYAQIGHTSNSLHYRRLAFDLNLFKNGKWLKSTKDHRVLGEYWESIGGSWGGRFADANHYSLKHQGVR